MTSAMGDVVSTCQRFQTWRMSAFLGFHVNVHVEIVVILVVKFLTDDFNIFQGVTHISTGSLSDAVLSLYKLFIFLLCIRRHQWSIKNL